MQAILRQERAMPATFGIAATHIAGMARSYKPMVSQPFSCGHRHRRLTDALRRACPPRCSCPACLTY
ncbi:MAG: hypothetical protein M0P70_16245 [Desulfobulbaceae bacterium]|nr:hypothetical protein [Desulfobulbaceae bacterium]